MTTDNDVREGGEPTPVNWTRTVTDMRRAAGATAAEVQKLIAANRWDDLCPPEPEHCRGLTRPIRSGGRTINCDCPLFREAECPHTEARAVVRAVREAQARSQYLASAGFGPKYHTPTYERIPRHLARACDEWLADRDKHMAEGTTLWLAGDVGCGKTMALAYVALELRAQEEHHWQPEILFAHAARLFDRLVQFDDAADYYGGCDVLMIDDLGREYDAAWPMARFVMMIEERYSHMRPTLITTNRMPDELRGDVLWKPVIDRLAEKHIAVWEDAPSQRRGKSDAD